MTKKKYADEQNLKAKIDDLFAYRKLNELLHLSDLSTDQIFVDHLYDIQTQIYKLDAYLESTWDLKKNELQQYWEAIKASLTALGYDKKDHDVLLKDIKRYERIEKDCRKDKWPTEVSFKKFYSTKSCDVQLIRHLIYTTSPVLKKTWKESIWTYYDLITEINDDISDVEEDVQTYNGNRFLISLLRKGILKTEKDYCTFISKVVDQANQYFKKHPKQEQHHELHDWIRTRSKETQALLEVTIHHLNLDHLTSSLLLKKMQ